MRYFEPQVGLRTLDVLEAMGYDVILIECGATVHWAQDRPPTALRTWVSEGGSLYASDLTWPVMATMFPDVVQFAAAWEP